MFRESINNNVSWHFARVFILKSMRNFKCPVTFPSGEESCTSVRKVFVLKIFQTWHLIDYLIYCKSWFAQDSPEFFTSFQLRNHVYLFNSPSKPTYSSMRKVSWFNSKVFSCFKLHWAQMRVRWTQENQFFGWSLRNAKPPIMGS